jgi:hypothetical protein
MLSWKSIIVDQDDLPSGLIWHKEKPNPDYKVKMAFAQQDGLTFRRLTFKNEDQIFFQIERSL